MAKSKKEFGEGPIYTITNYIFWLLMGNLYFALMNIPLLFILLALLSNGNNPIPQGFTVIIFVCCIPIGPAATALFSVMGKLVREKDINVTKDFFTAYKANFLQSTFLWTLELLIINILYTDSRFFIYKGMPPFIVVVFYVLIVFIILMGLFMLPIISRFYLKSKDIVKLSAYYTIKRFHITILNLASFIVVGFVFFKITTFVILFSASIVCFLIMYYEQKCLIEIEENFKLKSETAE